MDSRLLQLGKIEELLDTLADYKADITAIHEVRFKVSEIIKDKNVIY